MNIYNRVPLKRYNIEINYPTLKIFELAILMCLAPFLPEINKINLNEIGCNNINQNIIKNMIKAEK